MKIFGERMYPTEVSGLLRPRVLCKKLRVNMGWIIGLVAAAAWLNHIFTCFGQGLWGFLVAGAIFFPIGILHGIYLWFK